MHCEQPLHEHQEGHDTAATNQNNGVLLEVVALTQE